MRYSRLSSRVGGSGSDIWTDHYEALARKARGGDVIVMSVGDSEFDTPGAVTRAALGALEAGDTHYCDSQGRLRLRTAVAGYVGGLTGVDYGPQQVAITAGTQNALYAAAALLLDPGDEVLVLEPGFTTYRATIEATGAVMVPVPCPAAGDYQPDIEHLRAAITARTHAIFFASPANPTGASIRPDHLDAIAALARAHDLWIVSDEVYADFIFEGAHQSIASRPGMAERTIVVGSLSKSHAMTGWRIGWAVGPADFAEHYSSLNLALTYGLPGFIQEAGAEALENRPAEIDAMREVFRARRDLVIDALSACPHLAVSRPVAGMFVMVDVRALGCDGRAFSRALYQRYGVTTLDGAEFGASAKGWVRVSFAPCEAELIEGCRRITALAAELAENPPPGQPQVAADRHS